MDRPQHLSNSMHIYIDDDDDDALLCIDDVYDYEEVQEDMRGCCCY